MTSRHIKIDQDDTDDLQMNEDVDFIEEEQEDVEPSSSRTKGFNLDMRQRIEDRLEERRLLRELNEYQFYDIDSDDTLH
jgi:hypothetical protein